MLNAAREKEQVIYKVNPIRLRVDLSEKPHKPDKIGGQFSAFLKKENPPIISYPAKLSFTTEGKIKSFMNKQVLRDFVTTRPALQELLKEALHMERNNQY